ncbi:GNAT family acetyltransferase [Penicillium riverlandense]|uniref:GNAT family acetyltransferase n=1 Tax=Penicillium riverlandense TaxID=1903569 RepID=UPI00254661ED|nr:GNAT family acetyltransferase [Penicillium riverlandense]KAJ5815222.1 GNAT family acetyltransferase [Penicillium riverlandense]
MNSEPFRSKRLLYRAVEEDSPADEAFFHALYNDPQVSSKTETSLQRPLSTAETKQILKDIKPQALLAVFICKIPELPSDDTSGHEQAQEEPKPIGVIVVRAPKPSFIQNRSTNFGISIVPEHQGNGYGPEAISWLLDWCFLTAGLHRVELGVFEWNERARKIYERLGFVAEGRQRESLWKDGRWWDRISMGILDHEWAGAKNRGL